MDANLATIADGNAKMNAIFDNHPFERSRPCIRPLNSYLQSFTNDSMHLLAQHSTPVVEPSNACIDPADDPILSHLLSTLKAKVIDAYRAKDAAHKSAMDGREAAWEAAVDRANRRANEAEQELEKEREQHLALMSSTKKWLDQCLDQFTNAKLAAKQSASDAHTISSSMYERFAKLCNEGEVHLIVNGKTILNTETGRMTKEQELKLRDQIRTVVSHCRETSGSVRTGSAHHEATPPSRASQISNTDSTHPEQLSTSARIGEQTYSFDGVR